MWSLIHKILLKVFSIIPIAFALLVLLVTFYHDGYYIEGKIDYGVGVEFSGGTFSFNVSGPPPPGYELKMQGNQVMVWGPPPVGTELHLAFSPYYEMIARPTKLSMDYLFDPYFNTKLFMKGLNDQLVYLGIFVAISETIFNGLSRKYEKRTVYHVYKIDIITIKIIHYVQILRRNKKSTD